MVERVFDLVICGLLVATIVHLALVQRRLRAFRAERDRLQAFVTALDLTVERAESAIRRLRPVAGGERAEQPTAAKPTAVRERAPEDLLRAARAAAGGSGGDAARRAEAAASTAGAGGDRGAEPGGERRRGGRRAAGLADALQDAIGG
jgi:hypothetical protein